MTYRVCNQVILVQGQGLKGQVPCGIPCSLNIPVHQWHFFFSKYLAQMLTGANVYHRKRIFNINIDTAKPPSEDSGSTALNAKCSHNGESAQTVGEVPLVVYYDKIMACGVMYCPIFADLY